MHLAKQKILVLGLGISGLAMALWCQRHGSKVVVATSEQQPKLLTQLEQQSKQVAVICAEFNAQLVQQQQPNIILVSPGIAPAKLTALIAQAKQEKILVTSELWLFSQALSELKCSKGYQPQIIAITGTNGKTTVTALTTHLLTAAAKTVIAAGNIGTALLDALWQALQEQHLPEYWVLELSSFQLHYASEFKATSAVVLNIGQDHLDWHGDFANYVAAKLNLVAATAKVVLNRDESQLLAALSLTSQPQISFGLNKPTVTGDFGLATYGGVDWLVQAQQTNGASVELAYLMPAKALKISGRHNVSNALAALALLFATGLPAKQALLGMRSYQGEQHRVQFIALHNGISYYDDSKATNVSATAAALQGLAEDKNLIVILGGLGKGQDFSPLIEQLGQTCKAAVLIGRDAGLIANLLQAQANNIPYQLVKDMPAAVTQATALAKAGDIVLLSPACASLDMYSSYAERGNCFAQQVMELTQGGLVC